MSACISSQGEYGSHVPGEGADAFLCQRCYVFDEDGALAVVAGLRTRLADYENRITWDTTCAQCATTLDASIREYERAEALAGQVAAIRALPDRQPCTCRDDTPVGIAHHAARRGYNEALTDVRAALVASSPTTPEAKK